MIAIILSAGTGSRLMPLTKHAPKTLLKINNISLLERMIKNCISANISEFIVVSGYFKDKVINASLEIEKKYDVNITNIENKEYDKTNTSVSTYLASTYIENNDLSEDFILINGDNVIDNEIMKKISESDKTSLVVDNYKQLNEESFKLKIEKNYITEIGKWIPINQASGEFIGISKVKSRDLGNFNKILKELINEDPQNYYDFTYKQLSKEIEIEFVLTNGLRWTEIDDFSDWEYANELINSLEK